MLGTTIHAAPPLVESAAKTLEPNSSRVSSLTLREPETGFTIAQIDSGGTPFFTWKFASEYETWMRSRDGCPARTLSPAGHAVTLLPRSQTTLGGGFSI